MTRGTLLLGCCTRFDMMKEPGGVDVQALYPAGKPANDASWTWDAFLAAAEKCQKAGVGFGLPLGSTTDTNQWVDALFLAYGAELMDAKGNVTVKSTRSSRCWSTASGSWPSARLTRRRGTTPRTTSG